MKKFRYLLEALIVYPLYFVLGLLGFDRASNICAVICKFLGPKLAISNIARNNLRNAYGDELSEQDIEKIVTDMWDNLGHTIGEFPNMPNLTGKEFSDRVEIKGKEIFDKAVKDGKGFFVFSGHFANWEIAPKSMYELGTPLMAIYRPANNPYVDKLIRKSRANSHNGLFPKGKEGARQIISNLRKKNGIGIFVDQKMNEGIAIDFFGRKAMTASAIAEFAKKFEVPLLPGQVVRTEKNNFEVTLYPALDTENKTTEEIMIEINQLLETWVRENPAQWLWLHNRWGK